MIGNAPTLVVNFALAWLLITAVTHVVGRLFRRAWADGRSHRAGTVVYAVLVIGGILVAGNSAVLATLGALLGYGVLRGVRALRRRLTGR